MQLKPIAAIAVLLLVIASLSIAGCTTPTNNTATSPSPQAHNATLEKFVNVTKQDEYSNKSKEIVAWLVTWSNDSSVTILETVKNRTDNATASSNTTLIIFPSTQDATNYLNGLDKSDYSLISTSFKTTDAPTLNNVTGGGPSVYAEYVKTEGSILDLTFKATMLMQYDNIIGIVSAKLLSFGSGVSSASSTHASSVPALISIPSTSITPTPAPTPKPTPTPTPTPTVKPLQCYHVDITIFNNTSTPCNTCAATIGTLTPIYANNPYWSIHIENVNDQNGAGNRMIGVVRETGETTTFAWGDTAAIQAWSNTHLLCH